MVIDVRFAGVLEASKSPNAMLMGLVTVCHSESRAPLGCAVKPAKMGLFGPRCLAMKRPPKLHYCQVLTRKIVLNFFSILRR